MLDERKENIELLECGERPPLPKNLVSNLERIQRLLNQLKNIGENNCEQINSELDALNLKHYIPEMSKNIALNKFGARDQ